jgi:hypothetical protein
MPYRLSKLAAGSYDVILNGVIIAGLVRADIRHHVKWTAELLLDLPPEQMPSPFTASEHDFATLEEACRWLGISEEKIIRCIG